MGLGGYVLACVREAWRGSSSWATGVVGSIIGAFALALAAHMTGATFPQSGEWSGAVFAASCVLSAWVLIFLLRLVFVAPYRINVSLRDKIDDLNGRLEALEKEIAPVLKVIFDEETPYFIRQVGPDEPPKEIACVSVENTSSRHLTQCKVRVLYNLAGRRHSYLGLKHSWVISEPPFSLVPGEAKAVRILWITEPKYVEDRDRDGHVSLFSFVEEGGQWREGGGIPTLPPGNYEMTVEVLSANAPRPARLSLAIRHERGEWVIRNVAGLSAGPFRWPVPGGEPKRHLAEGK